MEKLVKEFLNKCVYEINKNDNKELIQNKIFNPILSNLTEKIYPYVSLVFIMYCINIILIIIILFLLMKNKKNY